MLNFIYELYFFLLSLINNVDVDEILFIDIDMNTHTLQDLEYLENNYYIYDNKEYAIEV